MHWGVWWVWIRSCTSSTIMCRIYSQNGYEVYFVNTFTSSSVTDYILSVCACVFGNQKRNHRCYLTWLHPVIIWLRAEFADTSLREIWRMWFWWLWRSHVFINSKRLIVQRLYTMMKLNMIWRFASYYTGGTCDLNLIDTASEHVSHVIYTLFKQSCTTVFIEF